MKLQIVLSVFFLLPISMVHAETRVIESQQVCEKRIDAFKTGLEASIKAKQNVDTAKAELDLINKLPNTLSPCEKQKRIPALSDSDETSKQANEALKDREISK